MEGKLRIKLPCRYLSMLILSQRSKEKNMAIEETRRRNEASMARKRANAKAINPAAANSGIGDGPLSPSSTGAMDSLLEKLRAAAPQARDQRDRRRRARLKDRHQVRVASGQTIPELGDLAKGSEDGSEDMEKGNLEPVAANGTNKRSDMEPISEGEDIADRAASLLQGLRGDDGDNSGNPRSGNRDGSLRMRRRRESADDERRNRRRRRAKDDADDSEKKDKSAERDRSSRPETSEGKQLLHSEPIIELGEEDEDDGEDTILADDTLLDNGVRPPKTVISPPSPEPGSSTERPIPLDD